MLALLIGVKVFIDLLVSHFSSISLGICSILLELATLYLAILRLTCDRTASAVKLNVPAVCVLKGVPIITTGCLKSHENGNPGMPIFTGCVYTVKKGVRTIHP